MLHVHGWPQACVPHAWPSARQQPVLGHSSPCTCGHFRMGMPCSLQAFCLAAWPASASLLSCQPGFCPQLPQQHGLAQHSVGAPLLCSVPAYHALLAHQQKQVPLHGPEHTRCWLQPSEHVDAQRRLASCCCPLAEDSQQAPGPAAVLMLLLQCQCPQQHLSCHAAEVYCRVSQHAYQHEGSAAAAVQGAAPVPVHLLPALQSAARWPADIRQLSGPLLLYRSLHAC